MENRLNIFLKLKMNYLSDEINNIYLGRLLKCLEMIIENNKCNKTKILDFGNNTKKV